MWVHSEDLPTSDGHPFFERLNRILEESEFDAFVEGFDVTTAWDADRNAMSEALAVPLRRRGRRA